MKKLFIILFAYLLCGCISTKVSSTEYGREYTFDDLFDQAKDLDGFSVIKIGEPFNKVERAIREHHKSFSAIYDKKNRQWSMHNGLTVIPDKGNILQPQDETIFCEEINFIVRDDLACRLRLSFLRDTLYAIDILSEELFVKPLFEEKYGIGRGYSKETNTGKGKRKVQHMYSRTETLQIWENEDIKASYYYSIDTHPEYANSLPAPIIDKKFTIITKNVAILKEVEQLTPAQERRSGSRKAKKK